MKTLSRLSHDSLTIVSRFTTPSATPQIPCRVPPRQPQAESRPLFRTRVRSRTPLRTVFRSMSVSALPSSASPSAASRSCCLFRVRHSCRTPLQHALEGDDCASQLRTLEQHVMRPHAHLAARPRPAVLIGLRLAPHYVPLDLQAFNRLQQRFSRHVIPHFRFCLFRPAGASSVMRFLA